MHPQKGVDELRVVGPFSLSMVLRVHISIFGIIPKPHQSSKWQLIVDVSYPREKSVNNGIPKELLSMTYITTDNAISNVLVLGPGTLLAKIDIRNIFRLVLVHPADQHLLAMEW